MANVQTYNWIAADAAAIAALQTHVGAGYLKLNGTLSNPVNNGLHVDLAGIERVITFTSLNDLSGVTIVLTGMADGAIVTESITGPNDDTVVSTNVYQSVTSIHVSGTATGISAGTGQTGETNWFEFDNQASVANLAISVIVTGTISYSFQVTLDAPNNNNTNPPPVVFAPNVFTPITAMTGATTTLLANYTAPFKYCNVIVNSSTSGATLVVKMLQMGLHS